MSVEPIDTPDLEYSGRDSNRALGFRRWNASSHASYYTPNSICRAIAAAILTNTPSRGYDNNGHATVQDARQLVVFDPTCGSGRLLVPFRDAGATVLGIEMDEDSAAVAKKNLASKNVRVGDLLLYRRILKGLPYDEGVNVVVTNPPFGIWWNVPENEGWETVNEHGTVESQAFTLELSHHAMKDRGLLVAIIPSSTFENGKDTALRSLLYKHFELRSRITIAHAFREEYGIDVSVDLIIAHKVGYRQYGQESREPTRHQLDADDGCVETDLQETIMDALPRDGIPVVGSPLELPQPKLFVSLPIETDARITAKGVTGSLSSRAMLDFLNASVEEYSPVQGTRVGVIDAYLSPPALIKRGWIAAQNRLRTLGFTPDIDKRTSEKIDRLRKKYDRLTVPLYRPRSHQLIGHFDDRPYEATADVTARAVGDEDGKITLTDGAITLDDAGRTYPLWRTGHSYQIHPTWIRKREIASEVTTYNESKKRDETIRTEIDRGYLLLEVETDVGMLRIAEVDEVAVSTFLKAFPLPVVDDVDDVFTAEVERNRAQLAKESPYLYDYQLEDISRLLTKPRGYLGWSVGGGKSGASIAWAKARQYRRVLVICESRLVENWLAECKKFGVEGYRLTTYASVANLRDKIRRGEKPSGFYITSYEFLALDGSRTYHPWDCVKFDKDGNVRHEANGITTEACECGTAYETAVRSCPKCEKSEDWSGAACRSCGFVAFTYNGERRQYPAYKYLKKLFPCMIADEAQVAKSKLSRRGQAVRSIKTKGVLLLTATLFKGYVTDLVFLVAHVLRWNNPLFPYSVKGGTRRFLDAHATYTFVTRAFAETLHVGKARLLPEVSSLNLFSRMMAPFMIRRVDGEMATLPSKHRYVLNVPMDRDHAAVYAAWEEWATDRIKRELAQHTGEDVSMGVISQSLWAMRMAASDPTAAKHLAYDTGPGVTLPIGSSWAKLEQVITLTKDIMAKGEKVIITSPLRPLIAALSARLRKEGINFTSIVQSTNVDARHGIVQQFNHDQTPVLLASMGCITRGLNITGANHIIVCAVEWSPESLTQVCGRIHRPGQTKEVHEYILLSAGTIDENMMELCNAKHAALKEAIDSEVRYRSVADILARANQSAQLEVARQVASRPRRLVVPAPALEMPKDIPVPTPDIEVWHPSAPMSQLFLF